MSATLKGSTGYTRWEQAASCSENYWPSLVPKIVTHRIPTRPFCHILSTSWDLTFLVKPESPQTSFTHVKCRSLSPRRTKLNLSLKSTC